MRLIDLDKALAKAENECRMSDDWKVSHEMMNVFKYQPTVDAIPIEWIEKQMAERENYGDFNTAGAIGYLLLSWEEENEIN